jgi:hypothetical protein
VPPGISLPDWIGKVVSTRRVSDPTRRSVAIERGISELANTGTCLVGEITTPPCEYPVDTHGVDLISFAEVLGLSVPRGKERLEVAGQHLGFDSGSGVSPHALFYLAGYAR